jgi:phenylacetyl-CoA:acceptor oxidoreductase subunit 2
LTAPLHAIGHGLPIVLAAAAVFVPAASGALLALAGVAAIAGGMLWKFSVIVRAGYTQGFKLSHLPQRGSGNRAAPSRPGGWTRSA